MRATHHRRPAAYFLTEIVSRQKRAHTRPAVHWPAASASGPFPAHRTWDVCAHLVVPKPWTL